MYMSPSSNDIYQSNDLYKQSFYQRFKRTSNDDEQIVKSESIVNENKFQSKRRSTSSSPSLQPINMHQQGSIDSTNDETANGVPSRFCSVCGDISTGIHFGGNSCESCKAFFRRSVQCNRYQNYKCSNDEKCPVNLVTRKVCQYCRYMKCTSIGMKPKWVLSDQEREEKYGSRRKRFRQNHPTEEDPEIYKFLTKEEKTLIEDIAHALYQSRATYPLEFPPQLTQYLKLLSSGLAPPTPPTPPTPGSTAGSNEKPSNPSANFLIKPIQRSVLFARMLKDFDGFSEDDKVNLLKGSAIETIVWSSNTLFDPKTHTFTNYVSRDQRAVMDDQIIPLDPLLKKLWGEELFIRTKSFLVSMCDLHIDEVTSTLLSPVILFSPDRPNVNDVELVKRLQIKYVTILRKYMNWRYGVEQTDYLYPKLLLQIINIRTLSLAHAEIIQKVMATSSVDPLVREVTNKEEILINTTATEKMNCLSIASTPSDSNTMDYDKTPLTDTDSNMGSDEEEINRKKVRSSIEDDDDSSETGLTNLWRKKPRTMTITNETEITNLEQNSPVTMTKDPHEQLKHDYLRSNSTEYDKYANQNFGQKKPHDHQVPSFAPSFPDDIALSPRSSSFRHLPLKKQSLLNNRNQVQEQMYRQLSSSTNDLSTFDHYLRSNQMASSPGSPLSNAYYHDNTYDNRQQYSRMSPATFQQQQNEQHLVHLTLANNQSQPSPIQSPANAQSRSGSALDADEQHLLNAIHAHPNKRELVLNLLRQMNDSASMPPSMHSNYSLQQQQQQLRPDPSSSSSSNYNPYQ